MSCTSRPSCAAPSSKLRSLVRSHCSRWMHLLQTHDSRCADHFTEESLEQHERKIAQLEQLCETARGLLEAAAEHARLREADADWKLKNADPKE
jgi:hypothetical protein